MRPRCDGRVNGILTRQMRAMMAPPSLRGATATKQSIYPRCRAMDWFASLAMTWREQLLILLFDERRESVDILLQHLLHGFLGELALVVEGVAAAIHVDFGLAEDRAGNTGQDVLQMLGGTDATERAGGVADNADRLAEERALAIGARGDVDGVLQHAGDRAVVFRRHEQHAVRLLQLFPERQPVGRGIGFQILVEEGNPFERRHVELQRSRRQLCQRIGDLERKALLAKRADDRDDGVGGHWISLVKQKRRDAVKPDRWKDASAWIAQFWKRIVFETGPIGRELGSRSGRGTRPCKKRRRSRHANDVMGQELRCAD